jgi:hypothetical protein
MQVFRVYVYGRCPNKVTRQLSRLEKAYKVIAEIKEKAASLARLNSRMANPSFVLLSRETKNNLYDRNVELTRELQALGIQIEDLGFKLEPSDLV